MRLSDYIADERPIIYFDETTFNGDLHQRKAWFYRGRRFEVPLIKERFKKGVKHGFTVYGAVGDCILGNGYFELHDSSNKIDFMAYMKRLGTQVIRKRGKEKPILILDNLAAHIGPEKRKIMRVFSSPEYIPTYSCQLNGPIETCWAILKRRVLSRFTKLLIRKTGNKAKLKEIVLDELHNKIDKQIYSNILRAHYPYLQELLDKAHAGEYIHGSNRNWED